MFSHVGCTSFFEPTYPHLIVKCGTRMLPLLRGLVVVPNTFVLSCLFHIREELLPRHSIRWI